MSAPRKPSPSSPLRLLPEARQQAIMEMLAAQTLAQVSKSLAADGLKASPNALSSFRQWRLQQDRLRNYNNLTEQFETFYTQINPNADRSKVRDMSIAFFMAEATANQDRDGFIDVAKLSLRDEKGNREKDLLQLKREWGKRQEELLALERKKFQRQTCELFLKWQASQQAVQIVNSPASNDEKIETLGKAMFGEDW